MARKIVLKNTGLSASGYTPVGYESVGYQNGILSQKDFTENVIPVGATGATGGVGPIGATGATGGYGPVGPTGPAGGVNSSGSNGYYAIFTGTSSIGNGSIYDSGTATVIMGTVSINIFSYLDGNQANGYILTSDSNGNATWQMPASGAYIPLAGTTASFLTGTIIFDPANPDTTLISSTTQGFLIGYGNNVDLVSATMGAYLQFYGTDYLPSQGLQLNVIGGSSLLLYDNLFQVQALSPTNSSNLNIIMDEKSLVIDQYAGSLFPGIQYSGPTTLANVLANQDGTSLLHRDANDLRYLMLGVGITGSGTAGYISKYTSNNTLAPSLIYELNDSGTYIGIGTESPQSIFHIDASVSPAPNLYLYSSGLNAAMIIDSGAYPTFDMRTSGVSDFQMEGGGGVIYIRPKNSLEWRDYTNTSVAGFIGFNVPGSVAYFMIDTGIGTISPTAKLHIQGSTTSNTSYSLIVQDSLANEIITVRDDSYTTINGSLYVATNPTAYPYNDYFYFNGGNLGINTLGYLYDPSEKLSVNGSISVAQGSDILFGSSNTTIFGAPSGSWGGNSGDTNSLILYSAQGSIFYYVNGNSNDAAHYFQSTPNGQGTIYTNMYIGNNGNIGIGRNNTTPTSLLDIQSETVGTGKKIINVKSNSGLNDLFYIDDNSVAELDVSSLSLRSGNAALLLISDGGVQPSLSFKYNNGASSSGTLYGEGGSMYLTTPGFGIGSGGYVPIYAMLQVNSDSDSAAGYNFISKNLSGSFIFGIRNDGNIGINNLTPLENLDILGNIVLGNQTIDATRYIGIGSGTSGSFGANSGFSGIELGSPQGTGSGFIAFHTHHYTVDSGEKMRIDEGGNVGIGLTIPLGKVHIYGSDSTTNINQRLEPISGITEDTIGSNVSTTNATPTTLQTISVPNNSVIMIKTYINYIKTSGSGTASINQGSSIELTASANNIGGIVSLDIVQDDYTGYTNAILGVNSGMSASGSNVIIQVTGTNTDNINWNCITKIIS